MILDVQRQQARTTPPTPSHESVTDKYPDTLDGKSLNTRSNTSSDDDLASSLEKGGEGRGKLPSPTTSSSNGVVPDDEDDVTYPEGGLTAWLVVLGSFCACFCGFGLMNSIGLFTAYVSQHQLKGYSESTIGWIFSLYVFLAFFCGLFIGPIFDAKGPRVMIFIGSVCVVTCLMVLGLCEKYYHFILDFSILGGLGTALLFTPAISAIAHFFKRRRGAQTGLAACGGSLGGVIFPLMLQSLIPKVGFAWATRIMGFICLAACSIAVTLVRSRLPPKQGTRSSSVLPDFTIFKDGTGAFALTTAAVFFLEWGLFIPVTYLTSYSLENGVDVAFSYQIMAIFNAASCFGRYLPGLVADRLGRFNTMIITIFACTVSPFAFWLPANSNIPLLVIFAAVFGFFSGGNISLTPNCVGQLCRTEEYGRYYATCYTIVSFGTLTGIPIGGAMIKLCHGSYWDVILFTGCSYVASLVCFIAVRVIKGGWNLSVQY